MSAEAAGNGSASNGPATHESSASSYYGQAIIKEPVWTWEIPCYLFAGGLAGASAGLAYLTGLRGEDELERRAWMLALTGVGVSPVLLISDLGRPARFLNMLRMFKVTSPMSVGSWVLSVSGASTALAAVNSLLGLLPAPARLARPLAAASGLPLATYTGALLSNTAVPVWHEGRRELPFVFAAGAAASAGALTCVVSEPRHASPARRLALAGACGEILATKLMKRRLGELASPYHEGRAGQLSRLASASTLLGAGLLAIAAHRGSRAGARAGGAAIAAGALAERWSIFRAGFQSAADPRQVVGPQRERIRAGASAGASRTGAPT